MKKILLTILLILGFVFSSIFVNHFASADELDELNKEIAELQQALEASKKATAPLESQLNNLTSRLNGIQARVNQIDVELTEKRARIAVGYSQLEEQQKIFNLTVKNSYIKTYSLSPLLLLLASDDADSFGKFAAYQRRDAERDKENITNITIRLLDLERQKATLEDEEVRLASIKSTLDKERAEVEEVVLGAKAYQSDLSGQIATLTVRQQEIMAARSGNFTFSIGSGELADEYLSSIKGFRETAPSGYFAIFSFGAYTHRNGMSQYGARARANEGDSYQEILEKYYPGIQLEKKDNPTIIVNGTNTYGQTFYNESYSLEDYLKHIYEVPTSWPYELLKAQAIAARSYAYGKSTICPGQQCQEFKREENSDSWKQAVKDTEGIVMTGGPGTYQYSSTAGGYLNTSGWDTTDGNGGSNFIDKAYEKLGGSPWLYKSWWRQGYSNSGSTCGRSNPWLSPEEMADIVNAAIALRDSGGIDTGRITPVTTSCWQGNPYTMEELRNLTSGRGGISSATSVSVSQGNNGITNNVTINGVSMTGLEFKRAVCLRAPGYIRIPQSNCEGGWTFFNVEKK